ncbi:MAG: site-specific DNA-methyltransferase, partial [Alphaproteobacteria bacterium]|nr:site-specific DNA-methyltransferase [Alphaproteobacteria bacterium]
LRGENLAALDALLPEIAGQVRCAWIDPPYNTGNRQAPKPGQPGYNDTWDSDAWLAFMRPRLERLRDCLRPDGSLFVQLDDNELDRLKLLLDEVFGREAFINRITVDARSPSAFSTVNPGVFKASEYLLWYARDRAQLRLSALRVPRDPDPAYNKWLLNPEDPHAQWRFTTLREACPAGVDLQRFQVEHAERVCRLASVSDKKAGRAIVEAKHASREAPERVLRVDRERHGPVYLLRGQQLIFYDRQVEVIDGVRAATRPLTNIWTDIAWEGIAKEGGVRFKQGKKPERLVRRCLQLATDPGDWVLDCFLGAGTTAAVAHKMRRRWIGIEQGPQAELARERLDRVVAGLDPTGITELEGWTGGGAFSYQERPPR